MTAGFTFHCYVVLRRNVLHEDGEPYRFLSIGLFEKRCFIKNVYTQFRKWKLSFVPKMDTFLWLMWLVFCAFFLLCGHGKFMRLKDVTVNIVWF